MAPCVHASASSTLLCSICWEELSAECGRTVVTLRCSHKFHLDCIGSAFNASGVMQCPNCREIENGVWRRFENDNPDAEMEEDEDFLAAADGTPPHYETVPDNDHLCPAHMRLRELLASTGYHEMVGPLGMVPNNPLFDYYRTGLPMINEISSSHVIYHPQISSSPILYHPPQCNCHLTSNLMNAHIEGANQSSAPMIPPLNMRVGPASIPNMESLSQQIIPLPGFGTQSIGSLFGTGLLRNDQMVYNNVQWMQPHGYSISPVLQTTLAARDAMNGFQQLPPEQSQRTNDCEGSHAGLFSASNFLSTAYSRGM